MVRSTLDVARRRESVIKFLAETYFQHPAWFSDTLTATFGPDSHGARLLLDAKHCQLEFEQFSQRYSIRCRVWRLSRNNPLREATFWHNHLFNPSLPADTTVLGFEPDWSQSQADPSPY